MKKTTDSSRIAELGEMKCVLDLAMNGRRWPYFDTRHANIILARFSW